MERWQKELICSNLPKLLETTDCNATLIATLRAKGVLADIDEDVLNTVRKAEGRYAQSARLYSILQTRSKGYEAITKAVYDNKQTGAFKILIDGFRKETIPKPLTNSEIQINHHDILKAVKSNRERFGDMNEEDIMDVMSRADLEYDYIDIFIMTASKLVLTLNTVPQEPAYYIPRSISNRTHLKPEIFKIKCSDIFVFKDIDRFGLTKLSRPNTTSLSSDQITQLTSRFILLEEDVDWEDIQRLAIRKNVPAHLIKVEGNTNISCKGTEDHCSYILEGTIGNSDVIWTFVDNQKAAGRVYVSEDEFVKNIDDANNSSSGVCICDTPGMGKSWLLGNIARKVVSRNPNSVVAFIPLAKFIHTARSKVESDTITPEVALDLTMDHISPSSLSRSILAKALDKNVTRLELFFDGLDEVSLDALEFAKSFLRQLVTGRDFVRIYVTSRPQLRRELERILGIVAFDILPLTEALQLQFLVNYWKTEIPTNDEENLESFGRACIKSLNSTIKKQERDIMGIPIQCYMVAQVYIGEATQYVNPRRKQKKLNLKPSSMCEIYEAFFETCFEKGCQLNTEKLYSKELQDDLVLSIKCYHVWKALDLLYPELATPYATTHNVDTTDPSAMHLRFGILESRWDGDSVIVDFVHRTLAEFIVSGYFGGILCEYVNGDRKGVEQNMHAFRIFADTVVRGEKEKSSCISHFDVYIMRFTNTATVFFTNHYLSNSSLKTVDIYLARVMFESLDSQRLYDWLQCSVVEKCAEMFRFLSLMIRSLGGENKKLFNEFLEQPRNFISVGNELVEPAWFLLCLACRVRCLEIATECVNLFPNIPRYGLTKLYGDCFMINRPLHFAVRALEYEYVEYLTENVPFSKHSLVHGCIDHTEFEDVGGRLSVLKLLLNSKTNLSIETITNNKYRRISCAMGVHRDIINFLIQNFPSYAERTSTVTVDFSDSNMTIGELRGLSSVICQHHHTIDKNMETEFTWKKFKEMFSSFSPELLATVQVFHMQNENISEVTCADILETKVNLKQNSGNTDTLSAEIIYNVRLKYSKNDVVVNLTGRMTGNGKFEYFLTIGFVSGITSVDECGNSILHRLTAGSVSVQLLMFFICDMVQNEILSGTRSESMLDVTKQNIDGNTFLHIFIHCRSAEAFHRVVKCIVAKGLGKLLQIANMNGTTPLQLAFLYRKVLPDTLRLLSSGQNLCNFPSEDEINFSDVMVVNDVYLDTVLHQAVREKRNMNFIQFLIEAIDVKYKSQGPFRQKEDRSDATHDVMKQDKGGYTFLHIFPINYTADDYHEIVKFIIEKGMQGIFQIVSKDGWTPLLAAVNMLEVHQETFQLLFGECTQDNNPRQQEYGHNNFVDLNAATADGYTIIHCALMGKRSLKFIQFLIDYLGGCTNVETCGYSEDCRSKPMLDLMKQDIYGDTFLHLFPQWYTAEDYHEIVKFVIEKRLVHLFQITNKNGANPLHVAVNVLEVLPETIELLTAHCNLDSSQSQKEDSHNRLVDWKAVTSSGYTIIHCAVLGKRSLKLLQFLIDVMDGITKTKTDRSVQDTRCETSLGLMKKDNDGKTFLHLVGECYTADEFHLISEYLLQNGFIEIFREKSIDGSTFLHWAYCQLELLPETLDLFHNYRLIETGDGMDNLVVPFLCGEGYLLLFSALANRKSLYKVQQLVKGGADWCQKDHHNSNVGNYCASLGLIDHLKYFVELGCDVNERDNDGDNALQCVILDSSENVLEIVEFLISVGVDTNNINNSGKTALMIAEEKGKEESIINVLR